jgi:hypothetical protein
MAKDYSFGAPISNLSKRAKEQALLNGVAILLLAPAALMVM